MGNRAVITTREQFDNDGIGVYVHWNGGVDSVIGFLEFCKRKGYRSPTNDPAYGFARLTQVIANWFNEGLSVGVGKLSELDCDNGDNGTYIIKDWEIVGKEYDSWNDTYKVDEFDLEEIVSSINSCQPSEGRL